MMMTVTKIFIMKKKKNLHIQEEEVDSIKVQVRKEEVTSMVSKDSNIPKTNLGKTNKGHSIHHIIHIVS